MNDLKQLKHFVALVECGHFAKAAEQVHLSQPALSRSVQALEAGLECALMDRHSRGIRLTAQGQLVYEHAKRLLAASVAMRNSLKQLNNLEQGELKVGAGPYPAARLVPQTLGALTQQIPSAQIRLTISDWQDLRRALLADEIEVFVADIRDLKDDPALEIQPLTRYPCLLFCRPEHPLLSLKSADALFGFAFAGTKMPREIADRLQQFTERAKPLSIECDNFLVLKTLVAQSDVISVAPWDVIAQDVSEGKLAVVPQHSQYPNEYSAYGLVTRQGYSLSPLATAFCRQIQILDTKALNAHDSAAHRPAPVVHAEA